MTETDARVGPYASSAPLAAGEWQYQIGITVNGTVVSWDPQSSTRETVRRPS
jgi:hypothetical protein